MAGYPLVIGWCLLTQAAQANPCTYPKRVVNGYTVDLQPLMNWWSAPKGVRPLAGWKHLQGNITQETAFGWVITGKAESKNRASTFLIKNPPRERLRRFQELNRQLAEYVQARESTRRFLRRPISSDWVSFWSSQQSGPAITLGQYKDAGSALGELGRTINAIHAELATMQNQQGEFKLDAFALSTHESFEGLPVFDYGLVYLEDHK
jgi:hypothetical protein